MSAFCLFNTLTLSSSYESWPHLASCYLDCLSKTRSHARVSLVFVCCWCQEVSTAFFLSCFTCLHASIHSSFLLWTSLLSLFLLVMAALTDGAVVVGCYYWWLLPVPRGIHLARASESLWFIVSWCSPKLSSPQTVFVWQHGSWSAVVFYVSISSWFSLLYNFTLRWW